MVAGSAPASTAATRAKGFIAEPSWRWACQARLNWVVVLSATVDAEPLVDCAPVQPPDAVHAVAFVADQASVELLPLLTVEGLAEIVTVGADFVTDTVADCAADPPAPEQDRV